MSQENLPVVDPQAIASIELTAEEISIIVRAMEEMPMRIARPIVDKINIQALAQFTK